MLPSYQLPLLTICATSVVRSTRTLLLVPTTCTQLCTLLPCVVCNDHHGIAAQSDGRMETRWALHKCTAVYLRWTRRAVTSGWDRGVSRPYRFGQTAHTCQHATRRPSMAGEFSTSVGFSAASPLIGFAEAFEHIQFHCLWRMEEKHRFPLLLLRFLIGVYGGPRLFLVENVTAKVVRSGGSAVVAGCVHATTLMELALVDKVDHTLKKLPSLRRSGGGRHAIPGGRKEPRSTRRRSRALRFPPRSWRLSPTTEGFALTWATTKCMRMLSVRARGTWQSTALAAGSARVMAMRAKRFAVKMTFLKRLRQAGAKVARLVKAATVSSLICGSDVTGMPPTQLNEARKICRERTYHRCLGPGPRARRCWD